MSAAEIASRISRVRELFESDPVRAVGPDKPVTAVIEDGLSCRVEGSGASAVTDMPRAMGGEASAPSPGWYARAAVASCTATSIAMRAAELGIELAHLEVRVDSDSDNRGLLGIDDVSAAFTSAQISVEVSSPTADDAELRGLVEYADQHSPIGASLRAAIPTTVHVMIT